MSGFSVFLLGEKSKQTLEYLDEVVPVGKSNMVTEGLVRICTIFFAIGLVGGMIFGAGCLALGLKIAGVL